VIVDTPGINAENDRHQEITEKVVHELCDLSIVLTPAPIPCSQTLIAFINKHLEYFHRHCLCLATQIDRVRVKERKRQLKFIADKFATEEIFFSKIYPVAALYAVHEEDIGNSDDYRNLAHEFSQTVEEISNCVKGNKNLVLTQNLQRLLTQIIDESVKPQLERTKQEYGERYDELQRNKLADYDEYIKDSLSAAMTAMQNVGITRSQISSIISEVKTRMLTDLQASISGADSKSVLKTRMAAENIKSKINYYMSTYVQPEVNGYSKKVSHAASRQWNSFQNSFNQEFRNIAKNLSYINSGNVKTSSVPMDNDSIISQLSNVANTIDDEQNNTVGAAVVGGFIGNFIIPGAGIVIGAAIGGFLGSVFGKSLDEHKEDAKAQAKEITDNFAKEVSSALYTIMYNQIYTGHCNNLSSNMKQFAKNNKDTVEEMISSEKQQQKDLKTKIKQIESNLTLLKNIAENSTAIIAASY
ncbi:MAG: dynamin family protein, partial [Lentisphaeria bacterium]|nr:dynamin family protein [Lentisphaeria bacterium]